MEAYRFMKEELEDYIDDAKVAFLASLVVEGVIDKDVADKWCASHTIVLKSKSIFRTITNLWSKATHYNDGFYFVVVKKTIQEGSEQ